MIQLKAQTLRWLLILSSVLLIIGFIAPMMTINTFIFIEHTLSVLSGIWALLIEGEVILFVLIALFSVVLPIGKIILLFNLLHPNSYNPNRRKKLLHLMHDYGRWAMLDVMVVAILIVSMKLGVVANVQIHLGFYIFSAAVILIMLLTQQVVNLLAIDSD